MNKVDKNKRVRAPNFTTEETRVLLRVALKEKHILENKKTDSETWKLKDKTWEKITDVFNATSGQTFRTTDTLRQKYDGLKKGLKKKINKNKEETMKTGGGVPEYVKIGDIEKELLEVLSTSIHGLPSLFDSDSVLPKTTVTGEKLIEADDITHAPITDIEMEVYEVVMLSEDCEEKVPSAPKEETPLAKPLESTSEIQVNIKSAEIKPWKNWSPMMLKTKKHPCLTPKKPGKEGLNSKLGGVISLREELVVLQIESEKEQEKRAKEKHEKEMEFFDLKIKIELKKLEMLNKPNG